LLVSFGLFWKPLIQIHIQGANHTNKKKRDRNDMSAEGHGGKHRRQASDVARAEASLGGGGDAGRHRRSHSRGLIVDAPDIAEAPHEGTAPHQQHSKETHAKKLDVSAKSDVKFHSPECLRDRFPDYDHYQPRTAGLCMMISALCVIIAALIGLAVVIDLYVVPGFRIIPIGNA
jgi:hypothetical protein